MMIGIAAALVVISHSGLTIWFAVFGEATLDDLDDDPDLEEHKSKCTQALKSLMIVDDSSNKR